MRDGVMGSTVAMHGVLLLVTMPLTGMAKMHNGAPCLFIKGSPHPGMTYHPRWEEPPKNRVGRGAGNAR